MYVCVYAYYHYTEKFIIINWPLLAEIFVAVGVISRASQKLNKLLLQNVSSMQNNRLFCCCS